MKWRLGVFILLLTTTADGGSILSGPKNPGAEGGDLKGLPLPEVPAALREAWVRFHETDLCLNLDSIFVFQENGLEVWCRYKEDRNIQQLTALLDPLRKSYRIELYATRAERKKKPYAAVDDDPIPSFWTNEELRIYLRDPFSPRFVGGTESAVDLQASTRDPEFKRRMKMYGQQILDWQYKMAHLAADLPSLARAGFGEDVMTDIRNRARAACLGHVLEVGKCSDRLIESLGHALPRGTSDNPPGKASKERAPSPGPPLDAARRVASQAHDLDARITKFLYPQAHTVTLADLREPGLIDALKALKMAVSEFEASARKFR
jgi:hypothetical protein